MHIYISPFVSSHKSFIKQIGPRSILWDRRRRYRRMIPLRKVNYSFETL